MKDNELQAVTQVLQTNKWNANALVSPFYSIREELTVTM